MLQVMQSFLCRKRDLHHIGSRTVKAVFQQGPLCSQEVTTGRYLVNLKVSSLGKHLRKDVAMMSGCNDRTVLEKTVSRNKTKNLLQLKKTWEIFNSI